MKEAAGSDLGQRVGQAAITVPGYFNDGPRHATKDTGKNTEVDDAGKKEVSLGEAEVALGVPSGDIVGSRTRSRQ